MGGDKMTTFNCPILIKNLEKAYGATKEENKITFLKTRDVAQFLKTKEEQELNAQNNTTEFK